MKIYVDGIYRDATHEEQAEIDELVKNAPPVQESTEERIESLEESKLELAEAIAILYEGGISLGKDIRDAG